MLQSKVDGELWDSGATNVIHFVDAISKFTALSCHNQDTELFVSLINICTCTCALVVILMRGIVSIKYMYKYILICDYTVYI